MDKQVLKINLRDRLESLTGWNAYDDNAILGADLPYIIYRIGNGESIHSERIDRNVEVEFWIDSNDTTLLDEKSDIVRKGKYEAGILIEPGIDYSYGDEGDDGFYSAYHDWEDYIDTGESNISKFMQRYLFHVY